MRNASISIVLALLLAACGGGDANPGLTALVAQPQLPTVAAVAPASGSPAGGTPITITGTNFVAGASVQVGGAAAGAVVVVNTTTITAVTPPGFGTVAVSVTTIVGTATLGAAFTYGPTLVAVAPAMGSEAGGTLVTLTGTNFVAPAAVTVGGNPATMVTVVNAATITCLTPPGVGVGDVKVTTPGGSATLPASFTFIPAPMLTAVAQNRGTTAGGTMVTLTGTGFVANAAGANAVTFGGAPAAAIVTVNDTTITCTTPPGLQGPVDVAVTNANGTATLVGGFAYVVPILFAADGRVGAAGNLYRIDPATAAATVVGPIGIPITGMAFHPDGTLYAVESAQANLAPGGAVANPRLLTINTSSGIPTVVGPLVDALNVTHRIHDVTFVGTRLLGISRDPGSKLVEIHLGTGLVTPLATDISGAFPGAGNLAADGLGITLYARAPAVLGTLFSMDPATGAATALTATAGYVDPGTSPRWNAGSFLAGTLLLNGTSCQIALCGGTAALVSMDGVTGLATLIGILPPGVDALAGTVP
jgi:hypothetical protein